MTLDFDCGSIARQSRDLVPQGASSKMVVTSQEPQAEIQQRFSRDSAEASGSSVRNYDAHPSPQDVLSLAAFKYLHTINPTKPEDFNAFVYYLEKVRKVLIVDTKSGSLVITVECSSLEILDRLWDDYCTGYLNEMAQKIPCDRGSAERAWPHRCENSQQPFWRRSIELVESISYMVQVSV
ncbi:hypothetical protein OS493_034848 [Desmophyllum pertusum]|uniref:TRADD-like N-terminal domain-containing protein n=1 Tax=Desmophyllum pertusum TaxID=174260 RepID=A0A9W9ZXE7_9CNID|nr:hypothetical protein OS493_034848 [Desmophyllum pertusum]